MSFYCTEICDSFEPQGKTQCKKQCNECIQVVEAARAKNKLFRDELYKEEEVLILNS